MEHLVVTTSCACGCESRIVELEARVVALEAAAHRRGDLNTEPERHLQQILPDKTRALPFRTSWLLAHAAADEDPTLRQAIAACWLVTSGELGCWLRKVAKAGPRDGVLIERLKGHRWRATYTSITSITSAADV